MTKQVEFYSQLQEQLVRKMSLDRVQAHLSKSLFLVVFGSNDLFRYYNNVSNEYTPQQYVDLTVSTLKGLSKRLYELRARKFVVSGVLVLGCCPTLRKESATSECNNKANNWSMSTTTV
ncbi:putative GDSL lipase/esterase, SGNH hydrolase superfamily [Helianthus anomalus]